MNSEQIKIRKFFDKLTNGTVSKTLTQMGMGFCVFLLLVISTCPAQDILMENNEILTDGSAPLMPMLMGILGIFATYLRICSYEVYAENQQNCIIAEILRYHPIDMKEVKKMKIFYQFRFLVKLTVVALLLQLGVTYLAYKTISWINIGYIVLFVFLVPFFFEVIPMQFRTRA